MEEIRKEVLEFAQKNEAFNALTFVISHFLGVIARIDGKEKADHLYGLVRVFLEPLYKEFAAEFPKPDNNTKNEDK